MSMSLNNKNVLITGAAQGIGRAMAIAFAGKGATLLLTDINEELLEVTRQTIEDQGGRAHAWLADVSDHESVRRLRDNIIESVGHVDVLVNNAGVVFGGSFLEVPLEKHKLTFEVNSLGLTYVTWTFLPELLKRPQSRLVTIASASALVGLAFGASYSASKWAAMGLSESIRSEMHELGCKHLKVTTVCPGYIDTGMFEGVSSPRLTPMLQPEALARKIVRATERGKPLLLEPFMVKLTPFLTLLPPRLFRWLGGMLGVNQSMQRWKGKGH